MDLLVRKTKNRPTPQHRQVRQLRVGPALLPPLGVSPVLWVDFTRQNMESDSKKVAPE